MNQKINFTNLRNEVIDHWENEGTKYFLHENNGFDSPDPTHYETTILPKYQEILDDPMACIAEIGFESISSYIRSKQMHKLTNQEFIINGKYVALGYKNDDLTDIAIQEKDGTILFNGNPFELDLLVLIAAEIKDIRNH